MVGCVRLYGSYLGSACVWLSLPVDAVGVPLGWDGEEAPVRLAGGWRVWDASGAEAVLSLKPQFLQNVTFSESGGSVNSFLLEQCTLYQCSVLVQKGSCELTLKNLTSGKYFGLF